MRLRIIVLWLRKIRNQLILHFKANQKYQDLINQSPHLTKTTLEISKMTKRLMTKDKPKPSKRRKLKKSSNTKDNTPNTMTLIKRIKAKKRRKTSKIKTIVSASKLRIFNKRGISSFHHCQKSILRTVFRGKWARLIY